MDLDETTTPRKRTKRAHSKSERITDDLSLSNDDSADSEFCERCFNISDTFHNNLLALGQSDPELVTLLENELRQCTITLARVISQRATHALAMQPRSK